MTESTRYRTNATNVPRCGVIRKLCGDGHLGPAPCVSIVLLDFVLIPAGDSFFAQSLGQTLGSTKFPGLVSELVSSTALPVFPSASIEN